MHQSLLHVIFIGHEICGKNIRPSGALLPAAATNPLPVCLWLLRLAIVDEVCVEFSVLSI